MAPLQCDTFAAGDAQMYFINATLNSFEGSSVAVHPRDGSNSMKIDGNGSPTHGHIICKGGQLAWYCWKKLSSSPILRPNTDSFGWLAGRPGITSCPFCNCSCSDMSE